MGIKFTFDRPEPRHQEDREDLKTMDIVSETLLNVSIYFLLFRIFSVYIITVVNNYVWEIRTDFGFLPIIGFRMQEEEFEQMNANSQIATSVLLLIGLCLAVLKSPKLKSRWVSHITHLGQMIGWYMGVVMSLLMYYFSLYLNNRLRFEVADYSGAVIIVVNVIALFVFIIGYVIVSRGNDRLLADEASLEKANTKPIE